MLKIEELKKILKKMMLFFVLQLLERVEIMSESHKDLIVNFLETIWPDIQFSVSGSGFSVLTPAPANSNSLYRALNSLKK